MPNLRTADGLFLDSDSNSNPDWTHILLLLLGPTTNYFLPFSLSLPLFQVSDSLSLSLSHYRRLCPFTSSAAISSLSTAATDFNKPLLSPHGETFVITALGKDFELILDNNSFISKFCQNPNRPLQRALPAITSYLPHDGTGGCAGTVFISEEGEGEGEGEGAIFCVKRVLFMFSI